MEILEQKCDSNVIYLVLIEELINHYQRIVSLDYHVKLLYWDHPSSPNFPQSQRVSKHSSLRSCFYITSLALHAPPPSSQQARICLRL